MSAVPVAESDCGGSQPSPLSRALISVGIVAYSFAMLAAVTGVGSGRFEPPLISMQALELVRPVLHPLHLDNAHRYYVPNPGTQPILWLHLQYESGDSQWIQWPTRQSSSSQLAHVRLLLIPDSVSGRSVVSTEPYQAALYPRSQIVIASVARRLAKDFVKERDNGDPDEIASLQFYCVGQELMTPQQIRAGWDFADLRLLRTTYLGTWSRGGNKLGESLCTTVAVHDLVSRIIEREISPRLMTIDDAAERDVVMEELALPRSIRSLVSRHPKLLQLAGDELRSAVKFAVTSADRPDVALIPGLDFDSDWVSDDQS